MILKRMFRLFDMLGRSTAMRALDDALRAAGVHPILVPEPVKLTVIQLMKKLADPKQQDVVINDSAELIAYCIYGYEQFAENSGTEKADCIDARVESALEEGDTLDAKLILLTLHAGLMAPEIADWIDLEED
jgi:hypothetical protein